MATDRSGSEQYQPHPWPGLAMGSNPSRLVQACIEVIPFDAAKYEMDKVSGYLRVDRPQRTSSQA
jgi:inorganic pyrophosphatase